MKRSEIDRRLAVGEPTAQVARDYQLNPSSLHRHRVNCLKLGSANAIKKEVARGSAAIALLPNKETLGSAYLELRNRIDQIVTQAQAEGSLAIAVSGLNSLRQTLDSLSRLAGHVGSGGAQVSVAIENNLNVQVAQITELLIAEFDKDPEIKARIAQALVRLDDLPQNLYGSELVSALAAIDRRYNNDALIVADLTNDPSYAEALFDMFGNRIIGVHICPHGDGTNFERRLVRNSAIPVYSVGRTFLFDRLLTVFRGRQIRLTDEPMARRLYEQLSSLEVELKDRGKIYKCLPGKHDDLAISCAMLNWAIRHPHFGSWASQIDAQHRPRPQRPRYGMKSFVVG